MSCKGQLPPSSQTGQSCGWLVIKNSTTDARKSLASSSAIEMNVPFDAGVMHDMTMRPVLSLSSRYDLTAHWRHAPTLPSAGCQQTYGISRPRRSEERRVRTEGVSTGRSRGAPYH